MAPNVDNPEADAIVIVTKEALECRRTAETPLETAAWLYAKHGIALAPGARRPLSRETFDAMWSES